MPSKLKPIDEQLYAKLSHKFISAKIEEAQFKCFSKDEPGFKMYFFTFCVDSEADLAGKWELVRDFIAIYFQSLTLEKDAERWNLYVFFFVKDKVSKELKSKIEQDKFSMRKMVVDGFSGTTDQSMIEEIEKELFNEIVSENPAASVHFEEDFANKHSQVCKLMSDLPFKDLKTSSDLKKNITDENLRTLINQLSND